MWRKIPPTLYRDTAPPPSKIYSFSLLNCSEVQSLLLLIFPGNQDFLYI